MLEIVKGVEQVCGHSIPVVNGPRRPGDIPATWADSSRLQSELAWAPRYTSITDMLATSWNAALRNSE